MAILLLCGRLIEGVQSMQDEQGNTPLHYAARNGNDGIIGLLLDRNAQVNSKNNQKNAPLHLAAQAGTIAVVKRLMKAGACVTAPNSQAYTAWGVALRHNHNKLANFINRHAVQATLRLVSKQGGLGKLGTFYTGTQEDAQALGITVDGSLPPETTAHIIGYASTPGLSY